MTMSAGLGASVPAGHTSTGDALAIIGYHLGRLFPAPQPDTTPGRSAPDT